MKKKCLLKRALLPCLLLVALALGFALVSKPVLAAVGQQCTTDADCTDTTGCRNEVCNLTTARCELGTPPYNVTDNACLICDSCGNGRCEPAVGEGRDPTTGLIVCPADCEGIGPNGPFDVCISGDCRCDPTTPDQCCCQVPGRVCSGDPAAGANFDPDCCADVCGDNLIDQPSETCDGTVLRDDALPFIQACRAPGATGCTYCGDNQIQAAAGEQCDRNAANTCAFGCNTATCQCFPSIEACLEGSGFNNEGGPIDCFGWSGCSLNKNLSASSGAIWGFLLLMGAGFVLALGLRKRAE